MYGTIIRMLQPPELYVISSKTYPQTVNKLVFQTALFDYNKNR